MTYLYKSFNFIVKFPRLLVFIVPRSRGSASSVHSEALGRDALQDEVLITPCAAFPCVTGARMPLYGRGPCQGGSACPQCRPKCKGRQEWRVGCRGSGGGGGGGYSCSRCCRSETTFICQRGQRGHRELTSWSGSDTHLEHTLSCRSQLA